MPVLLALLLLGTAGVLVWKAGHKYPEVSSSADVLTLLNFQPFSVVSGKETYGTYVAPEGLSAAQVVGALQASDATILRKHIPIPGPTTVPAYGDVWGVHGRYTGPSKTVTPGTVLAERNIPQSVIQSQSNPLLLAGILYAAAFDPTTVGKLVLVPIGAKQV